MGKNHLESLFTEVPISRRTLGFSLLGIGLGFTDLSAFHNTLQAQRDALNQTLSEAERHGAVAPGFIQKNIAVPFITREGHFPWLVQAAQNPVVYATSREMIWKMDADRAEYPTIGTALDEFFHTACQHINDTFPATPPGPYTDHTLYAGLVSAAIVMHPHFDFRLLGIDTSRWGIPGDSRDVFWGEKGFARNAIPPFLPGKRTKAGNEAFGKDRTIHAVHHALAAFLLLYTHKYNLPFAFEMSYPLRKITFDLMRVSPKASTEAFSKVIGWAYELKTSLNARYDENGETTEGLDDEELEYDVRANDTGCLIGQALFAGNRERVIELLKDPRLQEVHLPKPKIPSEWYAELQQMTGKLGG